jgi:hypothetical protein
LEAVTANLILVDSFLDWRPTQRDKIRFLLWWLALDAALAPPLMQQELTQFNRDLFFFLNRRPFVLGFIQDRMFRFTCKMECT